MRRQPVPRVLSLLLWCCLPLWAVPLVMVSVNLPAVAQTTQDRKAEADSLYKQGEDQLNQGQLPAALESLQKALELYRSLADRKQEGQTLRLIGNVYFSQKDYAKTIEVQQQTLVVARAIQDTDLEARALNNIGLAYASLKQTDKAVSYYEQSLVISRRSKNFKMIAISAGNQSVLFNDVKNYAKSRLILQDAISLVPEGVDKARLLFSLGNIYLLEVLESPKTLTQERVQQKKASPSPLYAQAISLYQQAIVAMKVEPDLLLQYDITLQIGIAYRQIGDYSHGIQAIEEAFLYYKQTSNQPRQLNASIALILTHSQLISSLMKAQEYSKALNHLEHKIALIREALALAKVLNQPSNVKDLLYYQTVAHANAAQIYLELQNLSKAKEQAEQAWLVAKQSGDPKTEKPALTALRSYYGDIGDYVKQLEVDQRELEIVRLNPNPLEEAYALSSLSGAYSMVGNSQKQLQLLQEASDKVAQITPENLPSYATDEHVVRLKRNITMDFALIHGNRGDYEQKLAFALKALELSRILQEHKEEFMFLLWIAGAHCDQREYGSAQQITQQALALAKAVNNPKLEIEAMIKLSQITADQHNPQSALKYAQQALTLVQHHKPKQSIHYDWINLEINALNTLINAYEVQGNYPKALELLQQAVKISEQVANPSTRQGIMQILGAWYLSLGDYANATLQFQQVLSLAQKQQNPIHQQGALSFLSWVAFAQQKPQQAIQFAQQGLEISQRKQYLEGELSNLFSLSRGYGELGDDAHAMAMAQATLDLARKTGNIQYQQGALVVQGNLHRRFGRLDQALASYEAALASGSRSATTYAGLAQVYAQRNQPTAAIAFYKQAINNFENYRRNLRGLSTDLQQTYLQSTLDFGGVKVADIYRQLADLLIAEGRILEAQQILELLRVEEIKDATQPLRGNQKPDNIALSPLEQELTQKHGSLIAFGRDVEKCRDAQPKPCEQLEDLIKQLTKLNQQYNAFIREFDDEIRRKISEEKDAVADPTQLSFAQNLVGVTEKRTQKHTVLVYPLVLNQRLWIVWVSSTGVQKSQPVPVEQVELAKAVIQFRSLMQECEQRTCGAQDTAKIQSVSRQLYDWLIRPIEPELTKNKVENLIFALDRVVRYIPMAALYDGNQYLTQKYTVSTVLSAGLTQVGDRAPFTPNQTQILGLGLSKPVSNLTVAGSRYNFAGLPYVPIELGAIVRGKQPNTQGIFPGEERLDNFDANTLATELYKRKHRILHLATHGKFVPGNALASFLLLGNGQPFTVSDIQSLTTLDSIDLIVLSACESALGGAEGAAPDPTKLDGIEISSMSYHFLSKQAKTVIASLWQVNDPSTALLMQQFYKYLADGKTKAEALQEAQKALISGNYSTAGGKRSDIEIVNNRTGQPRKISSETLQHPYYWAPFILIGNGL